MTDWKHLEIPELVTKTLLSAKDLYDIARKLENSAHKEMLDKYPFLDGKQFTISSDFKNMVYREPRDMKEGDAKYQKESDL